MALTMHQQSKKSDEEFSRPLMSREKQTMGYSLGVSRLNRHQMISGPIHSSLLAANLTSESVCG